MKKLFWISVTTYAVAWTTHLITGTLALRGFFGDGALQFMINLSDSFMFGKDGHFIHLFSVGLPRDFPLFLNALSLQLGLLLGIHNPTIYKYMFVFWQFALPGFLYLALFFILWRKGKTVWIVLPLVSWAVLSVPVDWNAVNNARWAIPLLWLHFYLVILAVPRLTLWPAIAAVSFAVAGWMGLYDILVLYCGMCVVTGAILWRREKNAMPLLYATASIPGALRALWGFIRTGRAEPNHFREFFLPHVFTDSYYLFIALALSFVLLLSFSRRITWRSFLLLLAPLAVLGVFILTETYPSVWGQSEMRFDYVVLSVGMMGWAGLLRLKQSTPEHFALSASTIALFAGTFLWIVQIGQTQSYQVCHQQFTAIKGNSALLLDGGLYPLTEPDANTRYVNRGRFNECLWDWTTPWAELLLKKDGRISQWPVMTFWQDFSFVNKQGEVYLHTNNWTLTSPSVYRSGADLPVKTPLYDLTPLFEKVGFGPLVHRVRCLDAASSGPYWHDHLLGLTDEKREEMFVCPRLTDGQPGIFGHPAIAANRQ